MAYVAADTGLLVHAVVLSWPERRECLRGPDVLPLETDTWVDATRWEDADRVQVQIDLSGGEDNVFKTLRYRADVRRGTANVDTVTRGIAPPT